MEAKASGGLPRWRRTLHSSPRTKGKFPSRSSSPQLPPDSELKTMVLVSPWQSKRALKCIATFSESWPMLMAKLRGERKGGRGQKGGGSGGGSEVDGGPAVHLRTLTHELHESWGLMRTLNSCPSLKVMFLTFCREETKGQTVSRSGS